MIWTLSKELNRRALRANGMGQSAVDASLARCGHLPKEGWSAFLIGWISISNLIYHTTAVLITIRNVRMMITNKR